MDDTQFMQSFDQYADLLIEKKGLSKLSDDKKENLKKTIKEKLIEEFNKEVLRELPDDKLDEFENVLNDENKNFDEVGAIIESAGLDAGEILKHILETFQDIFLGEPDEEKSETEEA